MADWFDYVHWRGDLTMDCLPFTPVDGLILSCFASLPLEEGTAETLGGTVSVLLEQGVLEGDTERIARMVGQSRRFGGMGLHRFEARFSETEEMQFAAVTFFTGDNRAFAAFRATDSTLVGWKEDLNMAFIDEVPAQREAMVYLNSIGGEIGLPLRVGGHSKGGNLAVYAAARCESSVQARIGRVYNFDGPGLSPAVAESDGYRAIEPRLESYLPEDSIVGILLERAERIHVVSSDAQGMQQHSPFTWRVTPSGFELLEALGRESLYADRTLRQWLDGMSRSERRRFVEALYDIVGATQARTVGEVAEDWQRSAWSMLGAFKELDLRTKAVLLRAVGRLLHSAVQNLDGT